MSRDDYSLPFEVHVHADIPLRADASAKEIEDALRPLWHYAGARSLKAAARSTHPEELGIEHDKASNVLHMCWTVLADEEIKHAIDEFSTGALNELCAEGARIDVSIHDLEFDDEEFDPADESAPAPRDEFTTLYVGPTPAHILALRKEDAEHSIVDALSDMFDESELGGVKEAVERLFTKRLEQIQGMLTEISSMGQGASKINLPTAFGGTASSARRPRRLH
jgi:hypothetical protein